MRTLPLLPACPICAYVPSEWEQKSDHGHFQNWTVACITGNAKDHEIWVTKRTRRAARASWRRIAGRK